MASFVILFPLALPLLPLLHPFPLSGARTRLLSSCLVALMMAFFPLFTSLLFSLLLLPSGARALPLGAQALPQGARSRFRMFFLPVSCLAPATLGVHSLPFSPLPSPTIPTSSPHRLPSSLLFLGLHPSSTLCPQETKRETLTRENGSENIFLSRVRSAAMRECEP